MTKNQKTAQKNDFGGLNRKFKRNGLSQTSRAWGAPRKKAVLLATLIIL